MTASAPTASSAARPLSPLRKALYTLVLLLLVVGAFECGLRCTDVGRPIEKLWIETATGYGNCFSVDEAGYFPLSIRESRADRERLRTVLKAVFPHPSLRDLSDDPLGIDDLVRRAPHCIVYDDRRREGFFDGRPRRVALVGDSFTFGEGVKDKDTLGYRLGRKVKHTNFLNFGLPGADIEQVRAIMRDEVVRLPDLHGVIYFFNLNDIFL